jgi:hypothetical protein
VIVGVIVAHIGSGSRKEKSSSFPVADPRSLVEPEDTKNEDEFDTTMSFLNPDAVTQIGDLYVDLVDEREE